MYTKTGAQGCVLVIITQGFNEVDTINLISILRQAGLCAKSVATTSGLVNGAYGIRLMPDLTFSDLDYLAKTTPVCGVILPENRQSLARLETDPRLHNFLRQVVAQGGQIVMGADGRPFLKKLSIGDFGLFGSNNDGKPSLLLREPGQPVEELARSFILMAEQPSQA